MYLRHRLQRALLRPEKPLSSEEMRRCDVYMKDLEGFPVTLELLKVSSAKLYNVNRGKGVGGGIRRDDN